MRVDLVDCKKEFGENEVKMVQESENSRGKRYLDEWEKQGWMERDYEGEQKPR